MERYTTLAGEPIEYERPAPALSGFLARVHDAANDPSVTESELVELVYGRENPLLRQDILPHHGVVTKEVFANPVYHVLLDLLARKRVAQGTLDPERAAGEYSLTVTEAAKRLAVHPSAVRQAIQAHKLDAVKRGGIHLLKPASVDSYRVSRRGPKPAAAAPALEVCLGNDDRGSFRLKVLGGELEVMDHGPRRVEGIVPTFERAVVISGGKGAYRLFEIEPAGEKNEIAMGPFHVRGEFKIARKENNSRRASEAWRAFEKGKALV